jgi:hypothetical protein
MADPTPASVPTPNYNFNLPTVGGDDNVWGGLLNDNWSSIDTILWNVSGVASAALTTTTGDARYLRLTGGAVTGNTTFPAIVATAGIAGDGSGNPPSLFIDPPAADNSAKIPSTRWVTANMVPLAGGAMTGPLVLAGISTAPLAPPGSNTSQIASTAFVTAAITAAAVPAPSNANPAMDGTAAPGASALYSRGDHVHPSDTSRLALVGGTMTGALVLAADPSAALGAATRQYVDAAVATGVNAGAYGGFVNKLRNATFDVWQRGASVAIASIAYTADGWQVNPQAVAMTVSRSANNRPGALALYGLTMQGAAGLSGLVLRQPIESVVAVALGSANATFQAWIFNQTGAAFTPTLVIYHATAQDNFATVATDIGPVSLQPCPDGAYTRVSYTFSVPAASAANGLLVYLNFGAAANAAGKNITISEADLRLTPGVAVGLNASPPPPEMRPIATELLHCQRYYQNGGTRNIWSGNITTGVVYYKDVRLSIPMRAAPTLTFSDATNNGFPAGIPAAQPNDSFGFIVTKTANVTTSGGLFQFGWTASAEL